MAALLRQVKSGQRTDFHSLDPVLREANELGLVYYSRSDHWLLTAAGEKKLEQLEQKGY